MKLVGRVPVEPLSDERLTNIERAIVTGAADAAAKGRPRESRWPVFGFAMVTIVLIAGAGLVGWQLRGGPVEPEGSAPLAVRTDKNATTIDIGDAKISSDPATAFTVTRAGTGVTVAMARGKVGLDVVKRGDRDPLIVRAGDTDVIVVGTRFTVDFGDGSGKVDVRVTEGKVKVVRHQQDTFVAAGEGWSTDQGFIAKAELIAKADRKPDEIVIPVDPGTKVGPHDHTAKVPTHPTTGSGSSAKPVPHDGSSGGRPRTLDPANELTRDLKAAIKRQPVVPALKIVGLNPRESVSKYLEMAAFGAKGDEASHAFYSMAVVQHLNLGHDGEAVRTLDLYFRRFLKDAKEYTAARWLLVRVKCLGSIQLNGKIDDGCRKAAFNYAHEAPAGDARTLAEELSTTRGD